MPRIVKILQNSRTVVFDTGRFDDWCVYLVEKDGSRYAPLDTDYFSDIRDISVMYQNQKVYNDFVEIYNRTDQFISQSVLKLIDDLVCNYNSAHQLLMEQWLTVLYAGMIAEENKAKTVLKKRIKHLGMYQLLILEYKPETAAIFSKGKNWRELDGLMTQYGF